MYGLGIRVASYSRNYCYLMTASARLAKSKFCFKSYLVHKLCLCQHYDFLCRNKRYRTVPSIYSDLAGRYLEQYECTGCLIPASVVF